MRQAEQHNHHCLITAGGRDWRIRWAQPGILCLESLLWSWRGEGVYLPDVVMLDIRKVDWLSYCATAVEWDKRYAG